MAGVLCYSLADASAVSGIAPAVLRQAAKAGDVPVVIHRRVVYFPRESFVQWARDHAPVKTIPQQ